jgi:hypothetical protein
MVAAMQQYLQGIFLTITGCSAQSIKQQQHLDRQLQGAVWFGAWFGAIQQACLVGRQ